MYLGDYRKAFHAEGGKIKFDDDAYVLSRPTKFRPSAVVLRSSQAFQQFVDDRLKKLQAGVLPSDAFEEALSTAISNGTVDCKKKLKVGSHCGGFPKCFRILFAKKFFISCMQTLSAIL